MKKKYVEDYKKGEKGYEYIGGWYETALSAKELRTMFLSYFAAAAMASVLLLTELNLQNVGSRVFFILIPCVCQLLPIAGFWRGGCVLFRISRTQQNVQEVFCMKRSEYDCSVKGPYSASLWLMFLSGFIVLADLLLLFFQKPEIWPVQEIIFAVCTAGIFLSGLFLWRRSSALRKATGKKE
ncbi:MAG: hypothetical protein PHE06_06695 [Lachnospiraceae bacterium]|nr:hypothetical protein [Lachnospiraceae bacterium]